MKIISNIKKTVKNWNNVSEKREKNLYSSDEFTAVKHPFPTTVR